MSFAALNSTVAKPKTAGLGISFILEDKNPKEKELADWIRQIQENTGFSVRRVIVELLDELYTQMSSQQEQDTSQ